MAWSSLLQKKTILPLLLAVIHLACCSAKSVNPKQPIHTPLAAETKKGLIKRIVTSADENTSNVTSQLISEDKHREDGASPVTLGDKNVTSHLTSQGSSTRNESSSVTSEVNRGNKTSHLSAGDGLEEQRNINIAVTPTVTVVDGCTNHRCSARSRCDSSEGIIHDTGLPYTCRCQGRLYGIFCTIPRDLACADCSQPQFYCLPTTMHWSGRFCYDVTKGWTLQGTDVCKGREFPCDGNTKCLPPVALCDGVRDCQDGTDETKICPKGQDVGK